MIKTDKKELVLSSADLLECIYNDIYPKTVVADSDLHHELHDKYTQLMNEYGLNLKSPSTLGLDEFDKSNQSNWFMPDTFKNITETELLEVIYGLDKNFNEETKARIDSEFNVYKNRGLLDLLKFLMFFVSKCREQNITLGVGRGSSVSSYILYLIGIHKVNSIKFNLDFAEFLKE